MAQVVFKIGEGGEASFWGLGGCVLPYELTNSKEGATVWEAKGPGSREISFSCLSFIIVLHGIPLIHFLETL